MITELTPYQQEMLAVYRDRWIGIGLSTKKVDRKLAEVYAIKCYEIAGLSAPKKFVWFESPLSLITGKYKLSSVWDSVLDSFRDSVLDSVVNPVADSVMDLVRNSVWDLVGDSVGALVWALVRDSVWDSVRNEVRDSVEDLVWSSLRDCLFGSHNAHSLGFYCYFLDALDIKGCAKIQPFADLAVNCGWWMPYKDICLMSELPTVCDLQDGVLHSEVRPAIAYADGFKIWAINGVVVDEQIVLNPQTQTIEQIRAEEDEEKHRIRIDRYGWQRYLSETNAVVLDVNVPSAGWMESLLKSDDGMAVLCTYDPSTGRIYALEVDPECQTCEQAQRYLISPNEALVGLGVNPEKVQTYPILRT